MRKSWILYGATIFLDAMKWKMNSLHWPYIGPVGLDHEKRVVQLCECLCIAEELKKYAFVLKSLEEMEPRRKLKSIHLIYSDCFIMDELLTMVGLKRPASIGGNEGTDLIWDSHHLRSQVWPSVEGLGSRLYDMVSGDLGLLVFGHTREIYDAAYGRIAAKLASNPAKLEYIKRGYYDHPERFAQFYVKCIPGNLGKSSSQPAESNHSSVIAHLGPGSTQDMVLQITDLYTRQKRLAEAHATEDAKYEKQSRLDAHKADNESEAEALCTLSKWGYNEYWKPLADLAVDYTHERLENGDSIRKIGMRVQESAHFIPNGERCNCHWRLAASVFMNIRRMVAFSCDHCTQKDFSSPTR
jgi:hypothetical protein